MSVVQEFKTFISRGSVIDLAIGVVIGGAFGKIVSSFVEDIILPPISLLTSGVNLSEAGIVLKEAAKAGDPVIAIRYGNFSGHPSVFHHCCFRLSRHQGCQPPAATSAGSGGVPAGADQ